ncbi:hypothetical protein [Trinickia dabaoshanensis]|uniref:hypothetical protein n=1 Tax=Trinickia dabaoshanensis TaxID=564714 RepID=UPI0018EB216A|nr:hypothetical protein [Trinickia dabaoshanensis]
MIDAEAALIDWWASKIVTIIHTDKGAHKLRSLGTITYRLPGRDGMEPTPDERYL